jgi:acetyltransferase-like isoleucine patch superfamily enzyme
VRPARRILNRIVHAGWRWADSLGTITPDMARADAFAAFGKGSAIGFPVATLFGEHRMRIGEDTMIGRHCTLTVGYGTDDPDSAADALVIGDRCVIGARSSITAHSSIEIGDDVWFGQDVLVSDSGHGYQDPDLPIGVQLGAHQPVRIGSGSWIGHGAIILSGTMIGRQVVVAAGSVVRGQVEDHAVIGGVPATVLRRYTAGTGWVATTDPDDIRPERPQTWAVPVVPGSTKRTEPPGVSGP